MQANPRAPNNPVFVSCKEQWSNSSNSESKSTTPG